MRAFLRALTVALVVAAAPSQAGPPNIQGLIDEGTSQFRAGSYQQALDSYLRAYGATKDDGLQVLIGRCHEELGQLTDAVEAYERFLGSNAPPEAKAKAEGAMRLLRRRLSKGKLVVQVDPFGASVEVDGKAVGVAPLAPLEVAPGPHQVVARAEGRVEARGAADVPGGGEATVVLRLAEVEPAAVAAEEPVEPPEPEEPIVVEQPRPAEPPDLSVWGWATLGAGAALIAGGAVTYALGEADHREIVDAEGYGTMGLTRMTQTRAMSLESSGDLKKTVGVALWGVGGASVVTAIVLLVLDAEEPGELDEIDPAPTAGAFVVPGGGGLMATGRF